MSAAVEILGHAQISTTMNSYSHVAPELQREAADRLGVVLWGGWEGALLPDWLSELAVAKIT